MEENIWIVGRVWQGGRIDMVAAYRSEEQARHEAGTSISLQPAYHITLWTAPLKDASNG